MAGPVSIRTDVDTARADKFATRDDGTIYAAAVINLHKYQDPPGHRYGVQGASVCESVCRDACLVLPTTCM
jgi:hypothetical protein